jgi:flavin-dependent dehydrogenase
MTFDAIVVGGGPSGSTVARTLVARGMRVAVVDRAEFPRVKLCGGWVSPAIWDALQIEPREYPGALWEWHTAHVRFLDHDHPVPCHGWFIRRYELDDFLLRRSGAELHLGVAVKQPERTADGMWSIAGLRSRILIGAGGTHCPVARQIITERRNGPVGAQELEVRVDANEIASRRVGDDGEPELLLFDDGSGYGWNVPKSDWINVGCGTIDPHKVREAWRGTYDYLRASHHIPDAIERDDVRGHSYYLFDPTVLDQAAQVDADGKGGAFVVGDALGLAHPVTAEGILPSVLSARCLADAIIAGDLASYPDRLRREPTLADYRRIHTAVELASAMRTKWRARGPSRFTLPVPRRAIARTFAWLFSGAKLPAPRLIDRLLPRGRE